MKYNEPQGGLQQADTGRHETFKAEDWRDKGFNDAGRGTDNYIFDSQVSLRWKELSAEDFKYVFGKKKVSHNGYLMRVDIKPVGYIPKGRMLADYSFGENSYYYLEKMTKLCKDNGIDLILIKSPSVYPYWYPEWDQQMVDFAKENDLTYINFLNIAEDEIGIDYSKDTFDGGLHLNLSGAENSLHTWAEY